MTRPPKEEADFLARWSRRKQDARHAPADEPAPPTAPAPAADAPEKSETELLEELGLPDPETLGPGSDFRAFMAEAVPDFIRRKALRRLWASNPALANLDMLVEYGEDYTDKARVVANLQTAYRAGRGYLDRLAEVAEEPAAAEETATTAGAEVAEPQDPAAAPDTAGHGPEAEQPAATEEPSAAEGPPAPDAAPADTPSDEPAPHRTAAAEMPPPRRRMRFRFDDER